MGQYFYVVNEDKKQFLHPHRFGEGLKMGEFSHSAGGTMAALAFLLTTQGSDAPLVGSWCGDRIHIVGDYADGHPLRAIHDDHGRMGFADISKEVIEQFNEAFPWMGLRYEP